MKNKYMILGFFAFIILLFGIIAIAKNAKDKSGINSLEGTVVSIQKDKLVIQDNNNDLYTFKFKDKNLSAGEEVILEYIGVIDKFKTIQDNEVVNYKVVSREVSDENGIFSNFYKQAENKMKTMSLDEKIKQLLLIRYPDKSVSDVGGYVFFEKDFRNKNQDEVKSMIASLQDKAKIPLLTSVDEEGGNIVRISSNSELVSERFKSPKELYDSGGLSLIKEDVKKKSDVLHNLGLNVNLAPVVDVATDTNAYMYPRTIGQNASITANYAKSVIDASKGTNVSYVLKHFPGYGNNSDTHISASEDVRSYDDIMNNDILPFKEGIESGAEAILVSHNIITSIDDKNPATLSKGVHNILKNNLGFTGVTITDDLDMGATRNIASKYMGAILAGNDLLIVTNYEDAFEEIKNGVNNHKIDESIIDDSVTKVLAWKYYKYLIVENDK